VSRVGFRPALVSDARAVAQNMRSEDVRELADIFGQGPFAAVALAMRVPGEAWTGLVDEQPAALFGCAVLSVMPPAASPWFLATPLVAAAPVAMLRDARRFVRGWRDRYGLLENTADARNGVTMRWLAALGFEFGDTVGLPNGAKAVNFWLR